MMWWSNRCPVCGQELDMFDALLVRDDGSRIHMWCQQIKQEAA